MQESICKPPVYNTISEVKVFFKKHSLIFFCKTIAKILYIKNKYITTKNNPSENSDYGADNRTCSKRTSVIAIVTLCVNRVYARQYYASHIRIAIRLRRDIVGYVRCTRPLQMLRACSVFVCGHLRNAGSKRSLRAMRKHCVKSFVKK